MDNRRSSGSNTDHDGDDFEDAHDSRPATGIPKPLDSTSEAQQILLSPDIVKHHLESVTTLNASGQDGKPKYSADAYNAQASMPSADSVSQTGSQDTASIRSIRTTTASIDESGYQNKYSSKLPQLPSRFQGFSAALPSVPWGPPPIKSPSQPNMLPTQAQHARKLTSPFSWLNRATSAPRDIHSPPLPARTTSDRRNTATSISTLNSNPDLMLKNLDDGAELTNSHGSKPPSRTTLRDRFKMLRMREEAGITSLDDSGSMEGGALAGLIGRSASLGVSIGSPTSVADEKEKGLAGSPITSPTSTLPPITSSTINPGLAPGTVSGVAAAPSDSTVPIDWDFWQSVVNEGPQVVARTSPEEMTQAIAGGIPQTIRGVIWQVLTNSKNEDLETVYHELVVRGTEKEIKDGDPSRPTSNGYLHAAPGEKESGASSSSSVHSDHSTLATSSTVGIRSLSPPQEKEAENTVKVQSDSQAERLKRAKEDVAALSKLEKMIKRDMGARTSYSKYAVAAGFQDGLFNVCKAYALFDEGVGYPQGMNFIIMPILFTMAEEEAFCLLVRLMNKYRLRELFIQDMPGLHLHLYQFERLLEDLEPALFCHLNRRGVVPKLYATQWFLTLFAYRFPLQLVMRVFDLVLSEGLEGAILKFGMAVIQRNVDTLLAMDDMLALTNFLKERIFDAYIDQSPSSKSILESGFFGHSGGSDTEVYRADLLVQDACSVKITIDMLNKYRVEWEEKLRSEKERETEIDSYRSSISSQAIKIRKLEEQAQKSDTEHVQIATELVRLKVENQALHDLNESLTGQVEELKKVVESEAASVEVKLKAEMERVMQRNIEVQNENRHMEDSMSEMERDLVETKMKYAEINENHEQLKQKWNDLRKALE